MNLHQMSLAWKGGGATEILISGTMQGETVFSASPGDILPGSLPFEGRFEGFWPEEGIEVDKVEVQATDLEQGGHVLSFSNGRTVKVTLEAGTHTYQVLLDDEERVPIIRNWMWLAIAGIGALVLVRRRR